METHQPDPTSDESTDPWDKVTIELSSLGERLRQTYRRVASEDGPTEEELSEALATLAGAWDQVSTSLSVALNDPETRARLKRAASALASALGAAISYLGQELDNREDLTPGPDEAPPQADPPT